ncbi:hypothetical protein Q4E40_01395 [Pontibacter sp. BT731]|uniref:hypothetical protein n=1 Tax=Pontibacter coccineus TaxID=3063328 RepID=UPI0026E3D19D|nr:hypothetical protein [Pontibacter sp. BT731]MDO6388761.1 hypothetical protein [Pontibacter sp. BT731]
MAVRKIIKEMVIADKNEVYALQKLLAKVKFSDQIDSYDLNEFAGSPLLTSLLIKAREEVIENFKEEGRADVVEDWLKMSVYKFDSITGKAIANRLKHLSDSTLSTLAGWSRDKVRDYAVGLIEPLEYENSEVDKLVDYIYQIAKEN